MSEPDWTSPVKIRTSAGATINAKFHCWDGSARESTNYWNAESFWNPPRVDLNAADLIRLELMFESRTISVETDHDYFDALCQIRITLEKDGMLLTCNGASRNVHPSHMSIQMGGGIRAYKLEVGRHVRMSDLVDIFTTDDDVEPVTVEEQKAFYDSWLKSIEQQ